jgi:hypothetical protein
MLVNEDLGAFTNFAAMIGHRVADFENGTAYVLLNLANGDGSTLATGNAPVATSRPPPGLPRPCGQRRA